MNAGPWVKMNEKIQRRTMASGTRLHAVLLHMRAGAVIPSHSHHHEQISYVVSGRLKLIVDGVTHYLPAGEAFCIKGGIPHEATAVVETYTLDTFSPPREDLIAKDHEAERT